MQPPEGPPVWTALQLVSAWNAAADHFDDLAQLDAHGNFDEAGVLDLAGKREHLGALAALRAHVAEPFAAVAHDRRDVGIGLDVVDQRRLAPESAHRRIRRPRLRSAAPSFDRGEQCRLFAADKRAGAETNLDIEIEGRIADAAAQQTAPPRLAQGSGQPRYGQRILRAHVDESLARANRVGCDRHAFNYAMRIAFHARCDP